MTRLALLLPIAALACASATAGEPQPTAPGAAPLAGVAPGVVDGATAHALVAAGVKVVDVRTPEEFAAGHVPGAVNIPYDEMARRFAEVGPPATPVLLYCHSGRRSGIAGEVLRKKGYSQLYDMKAYDAWVRSEPAPAR